MKLSVVIPFYNEEGNVRFVLDEVAEVLSTTKADYEIIAVDDGSTDATGALLKESAARMRALQIKSNPKNLGKDASLWLGFGAARGDIVITLDGDGQNDFHDVIKMLDNLSRYDAALGERRQRKDSPSKIGASQIAYFFRRVILKDPVYDTACGLKVMKKDVLRHLLPMNGFHRFIPFLLREAGVPFQMMAVGHRPRHSGRSKFSLAKGYFWSTIGDLFFMWWYKKRNLAKIICQTAKTTEKTHAL